MKVKIYSLVLFVLILFPAPLFALATEQFGQGAMDPHADWPEGTISAVASHGRVYSVWINGNERFYYEGNTNAFNKFLEKFAELEIPVHRVMIMMMSSQVKTLKRTHGPNFDWCFYVPSGLYRATLMTEEGEDSPWIWPYVALSSYSKSVDVNDVNWPANMDVTLHGKKLDVVWLNEKRRLRASADHLIGVKFKAVDEQSGEPLSNQELNICRFVEFSVISKDSSPYHRADERWYIRSVNTDVKGLFFLDLSTLDETDIVVQPPKPYMFTRFTRTSDLAGTKSANHVLVMYPGEVLTNKIYDLRTGLVKIIRQDEEPEDEPFTEILLTFKKDERQLYGEAEAVLTGFHKALCDVNYVEALSFCSEEIKSKAAEYDSDKDFFADIVPVKDLTQNYPPAIRRLSRHSDRIVRYNFETRLAVLDQEQYFEWPWSIVLESKGWVVDFETKPLNNWIKHAIMKHKALNEGFRQDQQKLKQSLRISLIPHDENFVIGQPTLFNIEMHNIGNETVMYHRTSWTANNPILVTDSNGVTVPYIDTDYQTLSGLDFIEPGQTIKLAKDYDVTSQYHIIKPGQYTFQFIGFFPEVPSNIVELEVKPGRLSNLDMITEKLLAVLPSGWRLTRTKRPVKGDDVESDTPYTVVHMIGERGTKGKSRGIELILFIDLPSDDKVTKELKDEGLQYWGQSRFGPVYAMSSDAQQLWPAYQEDIRSALDIE